LAMLLYPIMAEMTLVMVMMNLRIKD